jgi:hypothetical protein
MKVVSMIIEGLSKVYALRAEKIKAELEAQENRKAYFERLGYKPKVEKNV